MESLCAGHAEQARPQPLAIVTKISDTPSPSGAQESLSPMKGLYCRIDWNYMPEDWKDCRMSQVGTEARSDRAVWK